MKNNKLVKIIVAGSLLSLLATAAYATGGDATVISDSVSANTAPTGAFSEIVKKLNSVIGFVYWVIYIVAAILITMAGFDLKDGKIAEFAKKLVGGLAVFGSKFLIAALFKAMGTGQ